MHDRKNASAFVVILGGSDRISEQPADMWMAPETGRHARANKSVDLARFQHDRQRAAFRRVFERHSVGQRDGDFLHPSCFFQPAADPMHVGRLDAVVVFEDGARPDIGSQLIFRYTDFFFPEVGWLLDAVGAHIDRGVAEGARHKGRHADIGTIALRGLDREARHRQFAAVEFGMAEGAEEDFLRIERHENWIDAIDLYQPVRKRPGAIIVADGDGEIESGHARFRLIPAYVIGERPRRRKTSPRWPWPDAHAAAAQCLRCSGTVAFTSIGSRPGTLTFATTALGGNAEASPKKREACPVPGVVPAQIGWLKVKVITPFVSSTANSPMDPTPP